MLPRLPLATISLSNPTGYAVQIPETQPASQPAILPSTAPKIKVWRKEIKAAVHINSKAGVDIVLHLNGCTEG